jgi:8-oxo-dGTP pyrophosphatase MutT (NUDIX family)
VAGSGERDSPLGDHPGALPAPSIEQIRQRLAAHMPIERPVGRFRAASVLVPLIARPEGLSAVFTLRPRHMQQHGGQVSFPGGRVDATDPGRWETALREADEELAIPRLAVQPLGRLDDMVTVTGYHVTPWVGLVAPDVTFRPSPAEVEDWFSVPLQALANPGIRRTMRSARHEGSGRLQFYLTAPHTIWGATAHMLTEFLQILELVQRSEPNPTRR